jgi:phosphoribosylaminoimidazolecarboxamide formyltransferase/IMP cyclohydrolase
MPRALLSVSDKSGLVAFARGLADRGFELVSTGGTARALESAGLPVIPISDVTGFPEMMDGRGHIPDIEAANAHGITLIDLVAVNLYPFVKTAANPTTPFDALVEEIDIGGPSMVRAAAKNFEGVLVVVSPADYDTVLAQIDRPDGPSREFRFELARKAFAHTGAYDTAIASELDTVTFTDGRFTRATQHRYPASMTLGLRKRGDLRYGENPHQHAAWYSDDAQVGLGDAELMQGKELSYTNLLDLDAALRIVLEFSEPAAAFIKHTNPCGAAIGSRATDAYVRAREADPVSAFGAVVGLNRPIDLETAKTIVATKIDCVIAPAVDDDARQVLATKTHMRVVIADFDQLEQLKTRDIRSVLGAVLVQDGDRVVEAASPWPSNDLRVVTKRQPTTQEWTALRFAWRLCAHVKSNTVIFTNANRTLAVGAGQMSRVDAVNVARLKAGAESLRGSVAASDAFFPFRDGLDAVAAAGATAVVQPGGSVKDAEVIAAADEHGLTMVFTGRRHFRH